MDFTVNGQVIQETMMARLEVYQLSFRFQGNIIALKEKYLTILNISSKHVNNLITVISTLLWNHKGVFQI